MQEHHTSQQQRPSHSSSTDFKNPSGDSKKRAVAQYAPSFDLTTLNGSNGFVIEGSIANNYFGYPARTAGDLNGDGKADFVIGFYRASPGGRTYAGTAYVIFGQANGWSEKLDLTTLNGTNGFVIEGLITNDCLGYSVNTAGDLNADGKADLAIGAPHCFKELGVQTRKGTVYVIFGKASGWSAKFDLATLNGSNGFMIEELVAGDELGHSVSAAGDLNGDGKDDLVVSAPRASTSGHSYVGVAYVIFGKASGWSAKFEALTTLNGNNGFVIEGLSTSYHFGWSVGTAGDLNADGKDDLVIGDDNASPGGRTYVGAAYVIFGKANTWAAKFDLTKLNGLNGFIVEGLALGDGIGYSVNTAGDLNADGKDDLVLGAWGAGPGGRSDAGSAYVIFGQATGWPANFNLTTLNGSNGFVIEGMAANDYLGHSVSTAGDLNDDGKDDLMVGAPYVDPAGHEAAGATYVIFGQTGGWPTNFNLTTLYGSNGFMIEGLATGDKLGFSVSTAGDLNGDGKDDLIVGAPFVNSDGRIGVGAIYVIFGQNTTVTPTPEPTSIPTPMPSLTSDPTPIPTLMPTVSTPTPTITPISIPAPMPVFMPIPIPITLTPTPVPQINRPPIVTHAIPDQLIEVGIPFNFTIASDTFTDPDGDNLAYLAQQADGNSLPSWLSFDAKNRFFSGVTSLVGATKLGVQATDSGNFSTYANFTLSAAELNPVNTLTSDSSNNLAIIVGSILGGVVGLGGLLGLGWLYRHRSSNSGTSDIKLASVIDDKVSSSSDNDDLPAMDNVVDISSTPVVSGDSQKPLSPQPDIPDIKLAPVIGDKNLIRSDNNDLPSKNEYQGVFSPPVQVKEEKSLQQENTLKNAYPKSNRLL